MISSFTCGQGMMLLQKKFRSDFRKRCFTERVFGHWNVIPEDSGHGTKPVRIQGASGWCSQVYGLVLGRPARSGELDLVILMDPFQPEILYDPMILSKGYRINNPWRRGRRTSSRSSSGSLQEARLRAKCEVPAADSWCWQEQPGTPEDSPHAVLTQDNFWKSSSHRPLFSWGGNS